MKTIGADTSRAGQEKARAVRNHIPSVLNYTTLAHSKNHIFKNGDSIYISPFPFQGHLSLNNFHTVRSNRVQIPPYAHTPVRRASDGFIDDSYIARSCAAAGGGVIAQVSLSGITCP